MTDKNIIQANAGSKLVMSENKEKGEGGRKNKRTCLRDAILSVAPEGVDKTKFKNDIWRVMPRQGDTSIDDVKSVLLKYGLSTKIKNDAYNKKNGTAYHMFKEIKCRLLVRLGLKNKMDVKMGHFVGYDGNRVHDKPHVLELNREEDNLENWYECKNIFGTLYPKKEFNSWQIVGVFKLMAVK